MQGSVIRVIRKRLGITQAVLAERLGVDQGTVSRWERDIERPRPAAHARLSALLERDEEKRHFNRCLATVRHDLRPSSLLDPKLRLSEVSLSGQRVFRDRGQNASRLIGVAFEAYLDKLGVPQIWTHFQTSGFLHGDALLFTFTVNSSGRGNTTVWEPIVEHGSLMGVMNYVTETLKFPENEEFSFEYVGFVPMSDPSKLMALHKGPRANGLSLPSLALG